MQQQPMLSEQEWQLVCELLRSERDQLPTEIRHTDAAAMRMTLQARLKMLDDLLARMPADQPVGIA